MEKLQFDYVIKWQNETFGKATAKSKIAHLRQEVKELQSELNWGNNNSIDDNNSTLMEFADCFILLFGAASSYGMTYEDICKSINDKMEINKQREWGEPDKDGIVNHIK